MTNPLNCYSGDQHNLVERKLKIIIKLNSQPNLVERKLKIIIKLNSQPNLVERKLKIIIKLNSQPNPMLKSETGKKKQKKLSQPLKLASRS